MNMLRLPKKVYFKTGSMPVALRELDDIYHSQRVFLVTEAEVYKAGMTDPIVDFLLHRGIRVAEFFSLSAVPTFSDIRSAVPKLLEFKPDVILGVGGDCAMSAAKALLMQYEKSYTAPSDFEGGGFSAAQKAKLVLIAADFRTGAQNSPFAILKDDSNKFFVVSDFALLPEISVTDAQFTEQLTPAQIRTSGLALLAQAIRAYAAPGCDEFMQGLLRETVQSVLRYLSKAENGCPTAREKLHNAAALFGAVCGNVGTPLDPEPTPWPGKDDTLSPRIAELAKELNYDSPEAFAAVCKAL